jgi:hypothetical protein
MAGGGGEATGKGKKSTADETVAKQAAVDLEQRASEQRKARALRRDPFVFVDSLAQGLEEDAETEEPEPEHASAAEGQEVPPADRGLDVSALLAARAREDVCTEPPARLTDSFQDDLEVTAAGAMVNDIVTQLGVDSIEPDTEMQIDPSPPVPSARSLTGAWRSVVRDTSDGGEGKARVAVQSVAKPAVSFHGQAAFGDALHSLSPAAQPQHSVEQLARKESTQVTAEGRRPAQDAVQERKRKAASGAEAGSPEGSLEGRGGSTASMKKADGEFSAGDIVWTRSGGSWWPAQVMEGCLQV